MKKIDRQGRLRMYKDQDKQREANRKAQAKFKAKTKPLGITKQGDTLGITGGIADRIEGITEQANRERQRRYKARHKGVTSEGVTGKALPDELNLKPNEIFKACEKRLRIPDHPVPVIPKRASGIIINDGPITILDGTTNHPERTPGGHIRVSKPGDADYEGVA